MLGSDEGDGREAEKEEEELKKEERQGREFSSASTLSLRSNFPPLSPPSLRSITSLFLREARYAEGVHGLGFALHNSDVQFLK